MASYNSHPLPTPPGGLGQSQQSYTQNPPPQQRYPQQYQQQQQQQQQPSQQQHQYQPQNRPDQQQKQRPRSRGFSFRSDKSHKSHKSSGSKDHHHKIDLHETTAEKESRRLHTKADPSVAMNEAEPGMLRPSPARQREHARVKRVRLLTDHFNSCCPGECQDPVGTSPRDSAQGRTRQPDRYAPERARHLEGQSVSRTNIS